MRLLPRTTGRATSQVVELSRKLIMSGLLGLVGRGSIGQAVLAVVLAFVFFAAAFKFQPFECGRLNFFKICSEAQLFGVLVPRSSMPWASAHAHSVSSQSMNCLNTVCLIPSRA